MDFIKRPRRRPISVSICARRGCANWRARRAGRCSSTFTARRTTSPCNARRSPRASQLEPADACCPTSSDALAGGRQTRQRLRAALRAALRQRPAQRRAAVGARGECHGKWRSQCRAGGRQPFQCRAHYRSLFSLWLRAVSAPLTLLRSADIDDSGEGRRVALHALARLARQDVDGARAAWQGMSQPPHVLHERENADVPRARTIALAAAEPAITPPASPCSTRCQRRPWTSTCSATSCAKAWPSWHGRNSLAGRSFRPRSPTNHCAGATGTRAPLGEIGRHEESNATAARTGDGTGLLRISGGRSRRAWSISFAKRR